MLSLQEIKSPTNLSLTLQVFVHVSRERSRRGMKFRSQEDYCRKGRADALPMSCRLVDVPPSYHKPVSTILWIQGQVCLMSELDNEVQGLLERLWIFSGNL